MKNILITGGAGFVGSSLGILFKKKYKNYKVYALDNLKRRGSELNLPRLKRADIDFIHGDIRNQEDLDSLPQSIDTVIESSAEPSVLAGINGKPDYLINTNLMGTINCLNFATQLDADFIFLSTSRVYPIATINQSPFIEEQTRFELMHSQKSKGISNLGISEEFPIEGFRSLYGASKLCSELLIEEYNEFYNLKTVVNRCGVLTGPWQMGKVDQGVIVLWVARHFWKKDLAYFGYGGEGKQVRDILHINDLFDLLDHQVHNFDEVNGQTFNVGGGREVSVSLQELTEICQRVTGNIVNINKDVADRTADIRIYITDNSKVTQTTNWKPRTSVEATVTEIFEWIKENEKILKPILA